MQTTKVEPDVRIEEPRRAYDTPVLTEIGSVVQMTQAPQVRPREVTSNTGAEVFFLGDNA